LLFTLLRPHLQLRVRAGEAAGRSQSLTTRQRQLLGLVAEGLTNAQTARQLGVSPDTVRKHLENIYAVLGVRSRTAAVAAVFGPEVRA
jgi:DNA-binding CsgD family transcriptional regulator